MAEATKKETKEGKKEAVKPVPFEDIKGLGWTTYLHKDGYCVRATKVDRPFILGKQTGKAGDHVVKLKKDELRILTPAKFREACSQISN